MTAIAAFSQLRGLDETMFLPEAYRWMYLAREVDKQLVNLFQQGLAKGTVTSGMGNEAAAVGLALPLRFGSDVVSLLHRDLASHLIAGMSPFDVFCQFLANAKSPTGAREGNAHHGCVPQRRLPMISHLGSMLSVVVGGTFAARRQGEQARGVAVIGDGGTSTGHFHEALNLAAVLSVPVLFVVENNQYAFSTPTHRQYRAPLASRAAGYGIEGLAIDGTDPWKTFTVVRDLLDAMDHDGMPRLLELQVLRLQGHAAYDDASYVPDAQRQQWAKADPLVLARVRLMEVCGLTETAVLDLEGEIVAQVAADLERALAVARPVPFATPPSVFARPTIDHAEPYSEDGLRNGDAVNRALDYLLSQDSNAVLLGLDIGPYGSAFKTCKGLQAKHGEDRVIDTPICEAASVGFCLGAASVGSKPILEFQFADFATEACTQIGLNCATWYFRSGAPAPILFRMPCGGGLSLGSFHSGEFEGLWSRFPGLKLLYPATPQETFEALIAGFFDPNPCVVFEHKALYWKNRQSIEFDGNVANIWRARTYRHGSDVTVVCFGAMVRECIQAAEATRFSVEVINPFCLQPLDIAAIERSVMKTGRLLVVQESSETRGLGDRIVSLVSQRCHAALLEAPRIVSFPDLPIPFAPELEMPLRPTASRIAEAIESMAGESSRSSRYHSASASRFTNFASEVQARVN